MNRYHIKRDGEFLATINEADVMAWFHRNCAYSMNHAIKHEGYTVEDAGRAPDGIRLPEPTEYRGTCDPPRRRSAEQRRGERVGGRVSNLQGHRMRRG